MTTETVEKLSDLARFTYGGQQYIVYALPYGEPTDGVRNRVITFHKRTDGYAYPIAAPNMEWLSGYLRAIHETYVGSIIPLTQEQFLDLGGNFKQTSGKDGPQQNRRVYIG